MQLWQYCLLVTAKLLYLFRTLSASIIRSTINCRSSHLCMPWVGKIYPVRMSEVHCHCSGRVMMHGNTNIKFMNDVINHLTPNDHFSGRTPPLIFRCCIFVFIQQIYVLNILNMLHTLCFFLFKRPFIGSCIIHILHTECAKI